MERVRSKGQIAARVRKSKSNIVGGTLNLIQLYIGYIGASRAYGLHLEVVDLALFLTNEGITVYVGHKFRWAHKWNANSGIRKVLAGAASSVIGAIRIPSRVVAAASGAFATAAQALASPVAPVVSPPPPVVSVMPYTRQQTAPIPPRHDLAAVSAPLVDAEQGVQAEVLAG